MPLISDKYCEYKLPIYLNYNCVLNQTDLKTNRNKFYNIQILDNTSEYIVYIRYGRIGEKGKLSYLKFSDPSGAIAKFKTQFKAKTRNNWDNRDKFIKANGKYHLAKIDTEVKVDNDDDLGDEKEEVVESKLDVRIIKLLELLSDLAEQYFFLLLI